MDKKKNSARIGMVNFINTAPIYEIWKETVLPEEYTVIEEPPSVLNKMLATGQIDLGFVSSYEYCARPDQYTILPDLSISATGPVGSVFLFSHFPIKELGDKLILLSNQSETSASLLKILLEEYHSLSAQFIVGEVNGEMSRSCSGVMAIGDDALQLVSSKSYAYQFDLGEMWHTLTGLPFVFSVCAARRDFCERRASEVADIQKKLVSCRITGKSQLPRICEIVSRRFPMNWDRCHTYFAGLEYDLDHDKVCALEKFFELLIRRGEAEKSALPLRFFQN